MRLLFTILVLVSFTFTKEMKFCIQVAADKDLENLKRFYERVKDYPEARIEKREDLYLLRVGAEDKRENLELIFRKIKNVFKDAFIKECEINPSFVVYPSPIVSKKEEKHQKVIDITPIKDELQKVTKSIKGLESKLREMDIKLSELKQRKEEKQENKGVQPQNNNSLFILYGLLGFLTLINFLTLTLNFVALRRLKRYNLENESLLKDLLTLVKVLSLLSKGHIVKMEGGRLFIYDKKRDRWKEVS